MMRSSHFDSGWPRLAPVCAVLLLSGCALGPNYSRPALAIPQSYGVTGGPEPAQNATIATIATTAAPATAVQHYAPGQDIQRDWWTLFRSPALNTLIEQAFANHPGIESAQASLRVAQENVIAQQGYFFPSVQASYSPSRTKIAGNQGGNSPGIQGNGSVISTSQGTPASEGGVAPFNAPVIYNFHTAQVTVGFTPDIFGSNRRQVASLQAQQQAQRFQLEAAYITLASNIAAAAFQDALLRQQIGSVKAMITADEMALALADRQLHAGYISRVEWVTQQSALAQVKELLPPLQKQFEQNRDLLRVLTGIALDAEVPAFELDSFHLPEALPLTLPSTLVEQRPDIRMAEELLRSASEQVGVARAARFPQFALSGNAGGAASQLGQIGANSAQFFNLTATITQPLFDGGTLKHREIAANETLRGAVASYRLTVATAFQNVADVLHAIKTDADALRAAHDAHEAAKASALLAGTQHAHGYLDRLALISAEQSLRQTELTLWQAQASQLGDSAALFQALGGGWWHRTLADGDSVPATR